MNENENQLEKAINAAIDNVNSLMPRMEKCEGQETKIVELQKSIENFRKEIAALQQSNVGVPSESHFSNQMSVFQVKAMIMRCHSVNVS